jgi:hypothetical protein
VEDKSVKLGMNWHLDCLAMLICDSYAFIMSVGSTGGLGTVLPTSIIKAQDHKPTSARQATTNAHLAIMQYILVGLDLRLIESIW